MFKSRLKEATMNFLFCVLSLAIVAVLGCIIYLLTKISISDETVYKFLGVWTIGYIIYAIIKVIKFIHWLFIEPFKKTNKQGKLRRSE